METARTVRGHSGRVMAGYQCAAHLGAWMLVPSGPGRFSVTAQVGTVSEHWLAQEPLDLVLDVPGGEWHWHGVAPSRAVGSLAAVVRGRPRSVRTA